MFVNVEQLFYELGAIDQVDAIVLGGSRSTGRDDPGSDYDVYVYITGAVSEDVRRGSLKMLHC